MEITLRPNVLNFQQLPTKEDGKASLKPKLQPPTWKAVWGGSVVLLLTRTRTYG